MVHTDSQFNKRCSDVIDYVCGSRSSRHHQALLVFVDLIFIAELALMLNFLDDNVYDNDLPLIRIMAQGTDFQLARKNDKSRRPIKCINEWTDSQRPAFENLQWQVAVPAFLKPPQNRNRTIRELPVHKMNDKDILPLIEYDFQADTREIQK